MKIIRTNTIPENSILSEEHYDYHYCDSFHVHTQTDDGLDRITTNIFQTPKWADRLMYLRNSIFKLAGLEKGGLRKNTHISDYYPIGSRAVYFTVVDRNEHEILMAENDKHLNFRISVLVGREKNKHASITLTTLVQYNNFLGRFYFFLIRPFHRIIIKSLLKGLSANQPVTSL